MSIQVTLNVYAIEAIAYALGVAEDELYRYKRQQQRDPNTTYPDGESIGDVVTRCENKVQGLKRALQEARS